MFSKSFFPAEIPKANATLAVDRARKTARLESVVEIDVGDEILWSYGIRDL